MVSYRPPLVFKGFLFCVIIYKRPLPRHGIKMAKKPEILINIDLLGEFTNIPVPESMNKIIYHLQGGIQSLIETPSLSVDRDTIKRFVGEVAEYISERVCYEFTMECEDDGGLFIFVRFVDIEKLFYIGYNFVDDVFMVGRSKPLPMRNLSVGGITYITGVREAGEIYLKELETLGMI